jgi:hypothetical protein
MLRVRHVFCLILAVFAGQAVAACNAVLGIEEAELAETKTEALGCEWPGTDPGVSCQTCDDGTRASCEVDKCLSDQSCRLALRTYNKCAGDDCFADSAECDGCLASNAQAAGVRTCLEGRNCRMSEAASLCESYCACMAERCVSNLDVLTDSDRPRCLEICTAGRANATGQIALWKTPPRPELVYCWWGHCELAPATGDIFHCGHALGNTDCPDRTVTSSVICRPPKSQANGPCDGPEDCCSGFCNGNVGRCN